MLRLLKSKAFWSAIVLVVGMIFQAIGKPMSELQQSQLIESLYTIAGVVLTIIGGAGTFKYQNIIRIPKVKK